MSSRTRNTKPAESYLALVRRFPVRELHDDADHAAARAILDELLLRGEEELDDAEGEYVRALARFVEEYERSRFLRNLKSPTPAERLKVLMQVRGMSTADLGRLLGSSGAATMILRGARAISKSQIRKLADHFAVSPALFL